MKKEYIKPEMLIEEFISEIYMLGSSEDTQPIVPGEGDNFGANDRRGGWGDLWD